MSFLDKLSVCNVAGFSFASIGVPPMTDMLKYALKYHRLGFSIIPCKSDKRPIVKWESYQRRSADVEQIKEWWTKYPHANIGIITGDVSGVDVVDCDTEEAYQSLNENFLSDTFQTPVVKTPKGYHVYFKHRAGLSNSVRAIPGTDLRTTGGYVIAPPSKNGSDSNYDWFDGLSPKDAPLSPMPEFLFDVLAQAASNNHAAPSPSISFYNSSLINTSILDINRDGGFCPENDQKTCERPQNDHKTTTNTHKRPQGTTQPQTTTGTTNDHIFFTEGRRDNDLFHVANALVKGGCNKDVMFEALSIIAGSCSPPFDEREIPIKVQSAIARQAVRDRNLSSEVRDWVLGTSGQFSTMQCHNDLQIKTKQEKKAANMELLRLVSDKVIEKAGTKNGEYRLIDGDCKTMDWKSADDDFVDLWLPIGLDQIAGILPGNVVVLAGAKDSGKTTWLLNIAKENRHKYNVHYFNSEMGPSELKKRILNFTDISIDHWTNFSAYERNGNFHDVIKPGPGNLNIIDYLEVPDDIWKIGSWIQKIHAKLDGAVCVIGLQKKIGAMLGRGAEFSMEKARLYISMDYNIATIVSCKNFRPDNPIGNPRGYKCAYKMVMGAKILKDHTRGWHKDEPAT